MSETKEESRKAEDLSSSKDRRIRTIKSWPTTNRSLLLLASLILLYAYIPLDEELDIKGLEYIFVGIILAMVFTLSTSRIRAVIALGLALIVVVLSLFANPESTRNENISVFYFSVLAIFVGYAAVIILYEVAKTRTFNMHLIVSAISAYLLLALLWSIFYTILETVAPGSFAISEALGEGFSFTPSEFFELASYYSLITLTTVGYGDITPVTPAARSIASIEPIIGQILLTVLVAWLVGMYITESMGKNSGE